MEISASTSFALLYNFSYASKGIMSSLSTRITYSPEEIFKLDREDGAKIYKSGVQDTVELKVGRNYVPLEFKEKKSSRVVLATQYVALNVETYVDYVKLHDRPMSEQVWMGPSLADEDPVSITIKAILLIVLIALPIIFTKLPAKNEDFYKEIEH